MKDALANGDRIYSVIRATGCNQDGKTNGITVPNPASQEELCRDVCEKSGIDPATIQFVEAHGTGTPVGDPIEAGSLGNVYGKSRKGGDTVALGSVKANIGHTEAAAGVAGVIKACLSLHHKIIPPLANLEEPNPDIPFEELGLHLPREPEALVCTNGIARAAVNSFGYGGTNAHAIIERYPADDEVAAEPLSARQGVSGNSNPAKTATTSTDVSGGEFLFPVSARSEEALEASVRATLAALPRLEKQSSLADICQTASQRRSQHNRRLIVRCTSTDDLRDKLQCYLDEGSADGVGSGRVEGATTDRPVFVYTGMGPQWWGMGRELMRDEPVFRKVVEQCDSIFSKLAGWSIIDELAKDEESSRVTETQIAQPANFVVQYALTKVLEDQGIVPAAILGHSVGEVTAACIAGVLSLEEALTVSFHRSRIQKKAAGAGGMLAVGLPEAQAVELVSGHEDKVSIAAINSPMSITLAGDVSVLDEIANQLQQRDVFNRMLDVEIPYHSPFMDPLKPELCDVLANLKPQMPVVPLYSTVTATSVKSLSYDAPYWCENIREPVYFAKTMAAALADGHSLFLEIGPHPVLSTSIKECIVAGEHTAATVATLRRNKPEVPSIKAAISALYCAGMKLDWQALQPEPGKLVRLPLYPFQRETLWFESDFSLNSRIGLGPDDHPLLERRLVSSSPAFESSLNTNVMPYIPDHIVDGLVIYPAAGYIEAVLAMHRKLTEKDVVVLTDMSFDRALVIDEGEEPLVSVSLNEETQKFLVQSRSDGESRSWTTHATGIVSSIAPGSVEPLNLQEIHARCHETVEVEEIYATLGERGLVYREHFQRMVSLSRGENLSVASIEPHPNPGRNYSNYLLHPTLLDSCFQSLIALLDPGLGGGSTFVPVHIDKLVLRSSPTGAFHCVGELVQASSETIIGHLTLVDNEGWVLAEVRGFRCQALAKGHQNLDSLLGQIAYRLDWDEIDNLESVERQGRMLIFADNDEKSARLLNLLAQTSGVEPVLVSNGTGFDRLSDNHYSASFKSAESLDALFAGEDECTGVVWLHRTRPAAAEEVEGLEEVDCFASLIKALERNCLTPRVYCVTQNAVFADLEDSVGGLEQAPLAGFMRVALNEYPELHCTAIDVDESEKSMQVLAAEVVADSDEDTIAIREGVRLGQRVLRAQPNAFATDTDALTELSMSADEAFELEQGTVGSIDSLVLRQKERCAPNAGEIEIKVEATALNFKDIAKAMNIMSDDALEGTFHGNGLGLEASGRVERVGEGVTRYQVGDAVVFSMQGCFSRYAILQEDAKTHFRAPVNFSLTDAAALPTVFVTAFHALCDIANLRKGEKVLVHAGAGGLGLATIQVAQWIGAEIFATAGSAEKRDFLKSLGVHHVMDSRSLDFAEQIRDLTQGHGVDVVVNSLPREYIHKSLESLAPFGRFVEVGKKDLVEGTSISLTPFNRVLNFSTVDVDIMLEQRPDMIVDILNRMMPLWEGGSLKPIRTTVFPASKIVDAFKYMARSRHIGKVVIDWTVEEQVKLLPKVYEANVFRDDACYLVTGGLGGFGLSMAQWLIDRGVRHLALVGRSGAATDEARNVIASMQSAGAVIDVMKVDITNSDQVNAMVAKLTEREIPLRGVFHAAAMLDDAPVSELDRERISAVMRPKILGARNLDAATEHLPLDFFVLFSSVASVIGNARQGNYVAANAWLDAFAANRQARDLAATSINWGPIADVGMAASNDILTKTLAASGFTATTVSQGMEALERILQWDVEQIGLFDLDWSTWSSIEPASGSSPRFAALVATDSDQMDDNPLYKELSLMAQEDRGELIAYLLIEKIAETLRIPADKLEATDSISDLGMDSLMAVELQMGIKQSIGVEVSALEMMKGENIDQMGSMILRKMNLDIDPAHQPVSASSPAMTAETNQSAKGLESAEPLEADLDVDSMSDEEIEKLLEMAVD
ncbi:MAG: SDR family NAD(P)-dependent oxidoreductase [Granulosicoccus sp.]